MFRLIKNELYKIFHKKGTIITLSIMFLYVIFTNFVYKNINNLLYLSFSDPYYLSNLEEEITNFDLENGNMTEYASLKASYDTEKFVSEYQNKWQANVYYEKVSNLVNEYYEAKLVSHDEDTSTKLKNIIGEYEDHLKNDDWRFFVNLDLDQVRENIKHTKEAYGETIDSLNTLKVYEYQEYLLNYRLENDVSLDDNYLNQIINNQEMLINNKISYENAPTEVAKENYKESYANFMENQYILDNKVDTNNIASVRYILINFFDEYMFLIIIFLVMIAGAIVSSEFNKGTIKSLLTLPYKRSKILMAKFLTIMIMIFIAIGFLLVSELIVGGITFGFDSLSIPVIGYNFNLNAVEVMSVGKYFILSFIEILPLILLLVTLAFALSTLISSTAFAITITLCGYIGSSIINVFASTYHIKFLDYFVTTNWDLRYLMFGGSSPYNLSLQHSIIICLIYFVIMMVVTFVFFKKKNIKNI